MLNTKAKSNRIWRVYIEEKKVKRGARLKGHYKDVIATTPVNTKQV